MPCSLCLTPPTVYSVFAWFRMRSFAIARLSAPIDQKQVLFGLLLLVSVGLSAIVFAQVGRWCFTASEAVLARCMWDSRVGVPRRAFLGNWSLLAQIILLKISVTSLNVLMELTFLIILSVFLLQVRGGEVSSCCTLRRSWRVICDLFR